MLIGRYRLLRLHLIKPLSQHFIDSRCAGLNQGADLRFDGLALDEFLMAGKVRACRLRLWCGDLKRLMLRLLIQHGENLVYQIRFNRFCIHVSPIPRGAGCSAALVPLRNILTLSLPAPRTTRHGLRR